MDEDINDFLDICGHCTDTETEEDFLECMNLNRPASDPSPCESAPPQHAFGKHRLSERTPLATLPVNLYASSSTEECEQEVNLAQKIVIRRGKKPRVSSGPTPKVLKKKAYNLEPAVIASSLTPCCKKKCNEQFNYSDLEAARTEFWNLKRSKQLDWVTRQLAFYGSADQVTGIFSFRYMLQGKECCAKFLEQALPISHGRLSLARNRVLTLQMEDHQSAESPTNCPKADSAEAYIRDFARKHGQSLPNSEDVDLPAGKTKEAVFCDYLVEMFKTDEEVTKNAASLSTWYKTWRLKCHHVKAPKWQKFSKCSTCSNIKVLREFTDTSKQGTISLTHFLELMME